MPARSTPGSSSRSQSIVDLEDKVRAHGLPHDAGAFRAARRRWASPTRASPCSPARPKPRSRRLRRALDVRPVFKRIDTCAAEFASPTAYMYSTYEAPFAGTPADEAQPSDAQEGRHPRRRAEPHRPGHRVRLLLLPRLLRAERRRLRDHHGQLQPGDRLDRLRHLRPALFRAADRRGRARDPRRRAARAARSSASSSSSAARRR